MAILSAFFRVVFDQRMVSYGSHGSLRGVWILANGHILGGMIKISCIEALARVGSLPLGVGPLPPFMRH